MDASPRREAYQPPSLPDGPPGHMPALDGLRGLAILCVLLTHAWQASLEVAPDPSGQLWARLLAQAANAGWWGVDLFFVLSGFLITGILLDTRGGPHYFRNFYARRALRIFPLYYAVVLLRLAVLPLLSASHWPALDWGQSASYLLYAANVWQSFWAGTGRRFDEVLGVTWSLAVEEQFYLVWPLIIWYCPRRWLTGLCLSILFAAPAGRAGLWLLGGESWAAYTLTPCRMDGFAVGALLALLARGPGLAACRRPALAAAIVAGAGLAAATWWQGGPSNRRWPMALVGYSCLAVLFGALLVLTLAREEGFLARVGRLRILRSFGKYSYALYLFHFPVFMVLPPLLAKLPGGGSLLAWLADHEGRVSGTLLFGTVGTLLTFPLAWLSWHCYERHWLALKRFFEAGRPGLPATRPGRADERGHGTAGVETCPAA